MAIVSWPDDVQPDSEIRCAICDCVLTHTEATAGAWDAESKQAFACNSHFWNGAQLIRGWVEFQLRQRAIARPSLTECE